MTAPGFSTRGTDVLTARRTHWCARTPLGFAVLRHRQAGQLLRDRRLRQGSHAWPETVGITGSFANFWRRSIIAREGEPHKALRLVAQKALAAEHVLDLVPTFERHAETLLSGLRDTRDFDIVQAFTEPYAGLAITTLMGLPDVAAPGLARDAAALGLAMGPDAKRHEAVTNAACTRLMTLASDMLDKHPAGGFTARLASTAADTDITDRQSLIDLIVIAIFGGVDTTRAQLAFAAHLFARHPDQWAWLRAHPGHIPQAIDEVIRTRPTTTWATREAVEDFTFEGVKFHAGDTLHILVHSSGTDPAAGHTESFDIRAPSKMHFGFGGGAHHCPGHFVARTDMAAALRVWLRRWRAISVVGTPEFLPDSGNTSPRSLRIAPVWD